MIILAALGSRSTGGYSILVDIARLPRSAGPVRFVDVPKVEDCQ